MTAKDITRPRLIITDDNDAVRYMMRLIVEPECDVVGEARDGPEAITLAGSLRPDVLVIDISMPMISGIEVTKTIKARFPEIRVIIASQHAEKIYADEAARIGASGYVLKQAAMSEIPSAIRDAMEGRFFRSPRVQLN